MFKSFMKSLMISLIAIVFLSVSKMYAQIPEKSFGINAEFAKETEDAGFLYTFSTNFEAGLGITLKNVSYTQDVGTAKDSKTTFGFYLYGAYYLSKGDVSPYISLGVSYLDYPKEKEGSKETTQNDIGLHLAFGGQSFLTKNFAVYASIGINYAMQNTNAKDAGVDNKSSINTFSLFTTAIGAAFYFN